MNIFSLVNSCVRCGKEFKGGAKTLSRMNMDIICVNCKEAERKHPEFDRACRANLRELRRGNYDFKGIFNGQKYPFNYIK